MKIIKKRKQRSQSKKDWGKENIFRQLASILDSHGFMVRRETLKRGHGWKVVSGSCKARGDKYIFVDRRLSQDDQIEFLVHKLLTLGLSLEETELENLPDKIISKLMARAA